MGRKNLDRYTEDDWRSASRSVEQILVNGWPVYADCPVCDLRIQADLKFQDSLKLHLKAAVKTISRFHAQ